ncbi:MAG: DUF2059 domain-containing protein [Treponema sp.]|nr:DUF2059 domain-containing protein [Treponema sp.]
MKKIIILLIVIIGVTNISYGQTKEQDIVRLLNITNAKEQAAQMFDLMLPNLMSMVPQVPNAFWTAFRASLDLDAFVRLMIPIYDKHFTQNDIRELIRFYESPIGRKFLEVTPAFTRDSYLVGEQWGQQMAIDIVEELTKQGYF